METGQEKSRVERESRQRRDRISNRRMLKEKENNQQSYESYANRIE